MAVAVVVAVVVFVFVSVAVSVAVAVVAVEEEATVCVDEKGKLCGFGDGVDGEVDGCWAACGAAGSSDVVVVGRGQSWLVLVLVLVFELLEPAAVSTFQSPDEAGEHRPSAT